MNQANHSYTDSVENNSTFQTDYCFANDSVAVKVSRVAAYCLVLLVSAIGNSLLIFTVMSRTKRSQRTLNYFILNMTIADLLITFGYMPRAITLAYAGYEWQVGGTAGLVFCKLTVLFHETAVAVSNFTVAAISLDRFFAVVFPLKTFMTKRICATICVVVWLVAVSLRLPMVYSIETVIMFGTLTCFLDLDDALGPGRRDGVLLHNTDRAILHPFIDNNSPIRLHLRFHLAAKTTGGSASAGIPPRAQKSQKEDAGAKGRINSGGSVYPVLDALFHCTDSSFLQNYGVVRLPVCQVIFGAPQ